MSMGATQLEGTSQQHRPRVSRRPGAACSRSTEWKDGHDGRGTSPAQPARFCAAQGATEMGTVAAPCFGSSVERCAVGR
jgi:hypothetical protein